MCRLLTRDTRDVASLEDKVVAQGLEEERGLLEK